MLLNINAYGNNETILFSQTYESGTEVYIEIPLEDGKWIYSIPLFQLFIKYEYTGIFFDSTGRFLFLPTVFWKIVFCLNQGLVSIVHL